MHTLKFTLNEHGFGQVMLDGHEVDVASLTFVQQAGELNKVTLTIFAKVEGEVEVGELATVSKKTLAEHCAETRKPEVGASSA